MGTSEKAEERWDRKLRESDDKDKQLSELFDPKIFVGLTLNVQEIPDPNLGKVRYKKLTMPEMLAFRDLPKEEQGQHAIQKMLEKADPAFTWAVWAALPYDVSTKLLTLLTPELAFLQQTPKTQTSPSSKSGSAKTGRPS